MLYLEQIFSKLKKNNIVKSIRGINGGYILTNNPIEIKLSNIFSAVHEEVKTVQCKKESKKRLQWEIYQNALLTIYGMNLKYIFSISLIKKI